MQAALTMRSRSGYQEHLSLLLDATADGFVNVGLFLAFSGAV